MPTTGGKKSSRRPDITMWAPDGSIYRENVGLAKADGEPIAREVDALTDLERATGDRDSSQVHAVHSHKTMTRSSRLGLFMVEDETRSLVDALLESPTLTLYREDWHKGPLQLVRRTDDLSFRGLETDLPERMFVVTGVVPAPALEQYPRPSRTLGWVCLDLPLMAEDALLLGTADFRADPADAVERATATFKAVRRLVRKGAPLKLVARSRRNGGVGPARGVTASGGAANFANEGGWLKQRGVANVEFVVAS